MLSLQLVSLAAVCVSAFSVDLWLQNNMFERGALFHLIVYLFLYDYSVEEDGDIERNTKPHKQVGWLIGLFVFCVENGEGKRNAFRQSYRH